MTAATGRATEGNRRHHEPGERTPGRVDTHTVVICDDKPELRQSIAALLTHHPDFSVVGQAWDDVSCLDRIRETQPDLLILDVNMPGGGPNVVAAVKALRPRTSIVVFSGRHETHVEHAMRQAGADQYVLKTGRARPLLQALGEAISV